MDTGGTTLSFSSQKLMSALGKSPAQADRQHPVFEIAFETDNVSGAYEKACKAGAIAVQEPKDEEWGQTTSYVADIDGYLVEICSSVAGQ